MLNGWAGAPSAQRFLDTIARCPRSPDRLRRWAGIVQDFGSHSPASQMRFYIAEPNFNHAFRAKPLVYGAAMEVVQADNPFRPTDIGLRSCEKIPAAIIRLLFDTWLVSNCLTLSDRVSMGVGVETRLPFLDFRLIELVMALRSKDPDHRSGQKAWLRAALKGVLPDDVLARPKAGFQPPVCEWLTGVIATYGEALRGGKLVEQGIIAPERVDDILKKMPAQGWGDLFFAYKLVLLEMWFRKVVEA